ncbi:hypothetical protein HMPREF9148_02401 [Prevotella sp. F0091]|nr:hypothetical protein HMPREF9148_02401 [Prevotella sp. F0091]
MFCAFAQLKAAIIQIAREKNLFITVLKFIYLETAAKLQKILKLSTE